jgi:hypothetical protein
MVLKMRHEGDDSDKEEHDDSDEDRDDTEYGDVSGRWL